VPAHAHVYTFGRFRLDPAECRLYCDEAIVDLSPRLVDLLGLLIARRGELVSKEQLLATLWPDVYVTENALTRAISDVRRALGDSPSTPAFVQTVARRGYRFIAPVEQRPRASAPIPSDHSQADHSQADQSQVDALEPYRAWSEGRWQLETLHVDAVPRAAAALERAVALAPDDALARAVLANARFMQYEMTRESNSPARDLLRAAIADARQACALDQQLGEAWATLAFILVAAGEPTEAAAAARRAVRLQPGNWRHEFRLAHATWGEERLRAIDRTLALFPDFAFAHFVAAMVHIARRAFPSADALLRTGAAIQDRQSGRRATFPAAGLHWLAGLVCLLDPSRTSEAIAHFERERANESSGGIYAREFAVNAWHATGCACLASDDTTGAFTAFTEALRRLPGHALSRIGEAIALKCSGAVDDSHAKAEAARESIAQLRAGGRLAEAAIADAADLTSRGCLEQACRALEQLLTEAPPGFAGWTIPVEPLLMPLHGTPAFDRVLAILAERAA
jgi:DNA-binding winged helix-turn-helix (wHTH) protein